MPVNGDRRFYVGRGCGCCSHCRCTGRCGANEDSEENNLSTTASATASPALIARRPTPAPPPLDDNESVVNEAMKSKSIWSTLESLPHPNDMISSKGATRSGLISPTPLTPFVSQMMQPNRSRDSPIGNIHGNHNTSTNSLVQTTKHGTSDNSNAGSDQASFPGSRPNTRMASRKGLPEGGLSIEVPKAKKPSEEKPSSKHHSPERKQTKAKTRNMSRKAVKVEDSEEDEEISATTRREKHKERKALSSEEEDEKHAKHKNHKSNLHRKSTKHHDHSEDDVHRKSAKHHDHSEIEEHEESTKERKRTVSARSKTCRKHSKSGTTHLQLSKAETAGEIEIRTWAPTPQMGTFESPKYDRVTHHDHEDGGDDVLQQLQSQRDRDWEREQEREREQFEREKNEREHHEDSGGHKGRSAKSRSASRKHIKITEVSDSEGEKHVTKPSKHRKRESERHSKLDRKKSMKVRKKHSDSEEEEEEEEEESSEVEEKRPSRRSKHVKTKKKHIVHESDSEESHDEVEEEHKVDSEEEESDSEEEIKKKKSSKKKPAGSKHRNASPSSSSKKEEEKMEGDLHSGKSEENESNRVQTGDMEKPTPSPVFDGKTTTSQQQELKHTISIGNFSITRTRMVKPTNSAVNLRNIAKIEEKDNTDDNNNEKTNDTARDRFKTFLDAKMKDAKTISPKPSFAKLAMTPRSSPLQASHSESSFFIQPPSLRSTPSLNTLNSVKKLIVQHAPATQPNTLYFIDMGHIDEEGNPIIAFKIEADPNIELNDAADNKKLKKNGQDWLIASHESGTKVKGRLLVSAGKDGQLLFVIDVKRRHVDKFVIQGAPNHSKNFTDQLQWGNHDDYKHLYCHSPENRQMKWFVQEPGKLMRLFGRSEVDHGHIYAEARLANVPPTKKNRRTTKEATLCFYEHQSQKLKQQQQQSNEKEAGLQMDIGYLCATWWCARQTYDEGQIAAAHAEVEMIENIEKAFEVDLLAGA